MRQNKLIVIAILVVMAACGGPKTEGGKEMDRNTEIKLKQYIVQGKQLYEMHCSNCHQADGSGFARLYPPLAESDYLLSDLPRAACLIKNGMNGAIHVNGVEFNQMMPANDLTPLEIAEILTYITNAWGNNAGISDVHDINQWLRQCEKAGK